MKITIRVATADDITNLLKYLTVYSDARVNSYSVDSKGEMMVQLTNEPPSRNIEPENVREHDDDYSCECKMCGGERPLNDDGYCSRCWQIWNS